MSKRCIPGLFAKRIKTQVFIVHNVNRCEITYSKFWFKLIGFDFVQNLKLSTLILFSRLLFK